VGGGVPVRTVGAPRLPPVRLSATVRADLVELARTKGSARLSVGSAIDVLTLPGFWSVFIWRLANFFRAHHACVLSRLLYFANMVLFGADLPAGAVVGPGLVMPHPVGVVMASDVVLGARCHVMGGVRVGGSGNPAKPGHPVVGDDVWLMDGAKLFGPINVGGRSIIGASAIVSCDVAADMFVYGPRSAHVVRPLHELGLENHAAPPRGMSAAGAS
jgi:serine O-acetyltransferase